MHKGGIKIHMITSYVLLITFFTNGIKHCNIDGRNVWAAKINLIGSHSVKISLSFQSIRVSRKNIEQISKY